MCLDPWLGAEGSPCMGMKEPLTEKTPHLYYNHIHGPPFPSNLSYIADMSKEKIFKNYNKFIYYLM